MKLVRHKGIGFAALIGVMLVFAGTAQAALVFIDVRANLGGNDSVDWGVLGPAFTQVSNPFSINSTGGLGMAVSKTSSGNFERRDQGLAGGWVGNFAPGDRLIWTQWTFGPMSILFNTPVMGAGAQIQGNLYGYYTGHIAAYDSTNSLLGSFSKKGESNGLGNNAAIFLGVLSDTANIARIEFDVDIGNLPESFAINQMDIKKGGPPPIPEASAYAFFGLGVLGMMAWRRRKTAI